MRTRRSFWSGVERATTCSRGSSAAIRASSQDASSSPTTMCSRPSPAAAAIAAAVSGWSPVTITTEMPAVRAVSSASRMPSRSGSANPISARIVQAPSSRRRASATSRSPVAAFASTRACHAARSSAAGVGEARMASGAPIASSTMPVARDSSGSRQRSPIEDRFGVQEVPGVELGSPPAASIARVRAQVNEPGAIPSARTQASSSARIASSRSASRSAASALPERSRTEATSSRLRVSVPVLSVMIRSTDPRVSSALRRRTRTPRRSSRYAPSPRMTARRTGGSSGIAAIAAEMPASRLAPAG